MPSALGTRAMAEGGGGQEGYDHDVLAATALTLNDHHNNDTTSAATSRDNIALQSLDARAANTLSSATTIDVGTIDGTQDVVIGDRSSLQIDPQIQDSPAHDYHVHTEAANEQHRKIRKELGLDGTVDDMSEATGAAQSAAAAKATTERRSLDDLEKSNVPESSTHVEGTLSTDEKPGDITHNAEPTQAQASPSAPAATPLPESITTTTSPESAQSSSTPALNITLLLPTGARHAFRITESYLTKRGVSIPGADGKGNKDVFSVSVYQIKELILREWKEEWGHETTVGPPAASADGSAVEEGEEGRMRGKPSSPAAIRLIFFGRLLGDGDKVEDCRFNKTSANVVHMTVRPQDVVDEEEVERKRNEGRRETRHEERDETPGCRCVIM